MGLTYDELLQVGVIADVDSPHGICDPCTACICPSLLCIADSISMLYIHNRPSSKEGVSIGIILVVVLHLIDGRMNTQEVVQSCSSSDDLRLLCIAEFGSRDQKMESSLEHTE